MQRHEATAESARNTMSSSRSRETSTPQPPGYMQSYLTSSPDVSSNESARICNNGEALRGEGTFSAPPPPGFNTDSHEERVRLANHAIWNDTTESANWSLDTRTTSFSNLAAMVGTGLAESMEDSTQDGRRDGMLYDLSYARQSRHAASRLLGSSGLSPTAALLDLTFPVHSQKRVSDAAQFLNLNGLSGIKKESPTSLPPYSPSAENDPMAEFRSTVQHRSNQPPLGIFYSSRPTEVGVTVMEPDMGRKSAPPQLYEEQQQLSRQGTPVISRQGTPDISELHRGMQTMNLETRSVQSNGEISQHSASEADLEPFLWDVHYAEPSRAIAILRAGNLQVSDIRSTCEAFGILEMFRSEFADRGIIFVGYYDIRSAQYAAVELQQALRRLSPYDSDVEVKFCVPLNSSSTHDESIIVLSDIPHTVSEQSLMSSLASYGSVRSLHLQSEAHYGGNTYVVEFHNAQDAKFALLEMDSSQPWGTGVIVEVGTRRAVDRRRGRELLNVIGNWRHGNSSNQQSNYHNLANTYGGGHRGQGSYNQTTGNNYESPTNPGQRVFNSVIHGQNSPGRMRASDTSHSPPVATTHEPYTHFRSDSGGASTSNMSQTTQLVVGPDGRYSYVVVNNAAFPQPRPTPQPVLHHIDPRTGGRLRQGQFGQQQQVVQGPHGTYITTTVPSNQSHMHQAYWNHAPQHHQPYQHAVGSAAAVRGMSYSGAEGGMYSPNGQTSATVPAYAHVVPSQTDSSISSSSTNNPHHGNNANGVNPNNMVGSGMRRQHHHNQSLAGSAGDDKDNRHLTLDVDAVQAGRDVRTSLMIRNIPNKYTQQMLLAEFTENGHGPGKIDFFYLPIDFKNKCNRGYAFVNFVECKDIVPFHRQYFGQNWRVFNSDKICDITYARIQGKANMLKRFENSALMEKEEEYKPLVFVSHGIEKGKQLSFPSSDITK